MRLIRGWEERFSPGRTGEVYGAIGEEDGLGDRREGEVRARWDGGHLAVEWESSDRLPGAVRRISEDYHGSARETEAFRRAFAKRDDDPDLALHRTGPTEWSTSQNLVVSAKGIDSPYLFCLSREPTTKSEWEKLRTAVPERYDTWTVTEDVDAVQFEIECGIKRWLASQRISRHAIDTPANSPESGAVVSRGKPPAEPPTDSMSSGSTRVAIAKSPPRPDVDQPFASSAVPPSGRSFPSPP